MENTGYSIQYAWKDEIATRRYSCIAATLIKYLSQKHEINLGQLPRRNSNLTK